MTTLQLLIVCLTVIVVFAISSATILVKSRSHGSLSPVGKTVVVNTRKPDDQSIRGVIHAFDPELIVLRDAIFLEHGGNQHAAAGLVSIPRAGVSSMQEIEPEKLAA